MFFLQRDFFFFFTILFKSRTTVRICHCVAEKAPERHREAVQFFLSESPFLYVRLELFWLFHPCFEEVGAPQGKGYVMSVHQSDPTTMLVLNFVTAGGLLSFVSSQLKLNLMRTAPLKQRYRV